MSKFWNDRVEALKPYVPGEQPKVDGLIKLNTNEHPYGPSPRVFQAISQENNSSLRLYPDPESAKLKAVLADYFSLPVDHIFLGNGSDEVLAHIFFGLLKQELPILMPDITYSFYPVYCNIYDVDYRSIPLNESYRINYSDYNIPNGGIIIANPNAPTGCALLLQDIESILKENTDSVVVIDEAYVDFGAESAAALISKYPNLLVVQTFSKSRGLAGMRVGFALGHPELIEALTRIKNSFNSYPLDRMAQVAAIAAVEDDKYFRETSLRIQQTREWLSGELLSKGFNVLPSMANFIFARPNFEPAQSVQQKLREKCILVRHFKLPRLEDYLRITIGTRAECEALMSALSDIEMT
jgi:histidinol-phosphate aminotransferase